MSAANAVEVSISLHPLLDNVAEVVELTTGAGPVLTLWNRARGRVGDDPHKLRAVNRARARVARHLLDADVAQERDELGHLP